MTLMPLLRQRPLSVVHQRSNERHGDGAPHDNSAFNGLIRIQGLGQYPASNPGKFRPAIYFASVDQFATKKLGFGKGRRLNQLSHEISLVKTAIAPATSQRTAFHLAALIPSTGNRSSQITNQCSRHNGRHGGADDDTALGLGVCGLLKIDPPNQPDHIVADLQVNAFNEAAPDDFGLSQGCGVYSFRHPSSPQVMSS